MPMYFTGKRASSYVVITDPSLPGGKKEFENRQCAHCGYQWIYQPGSGKKRGICLGCNGMTCGKQACETKCLVLEKRFDMYEKGEIKIL